jgi:hypothetical protein
LDADAVADGDRSFVVVVGEHGDVAQGHAIVALRVDRAVVW